MKIPVLKLLRKHGILFAKSSKSVMDNKKVNYQVHDSITFEEVDDASNYQLQPIPQKVCYMDSFSCFCS